MIPIRMRVRNFLSYGDTPAELDYGPFDIACVTGDNGHGKSAMVVDAVTCALWGQARGTDARGAGLDDLIRLGAEEMELEFVFEMGGQVYRVLRKRLRNRQSVLEFQARSGSAWRPLTAERIQDTQERINRVLGIDYVTFVHSAFVLQGRADAFTLARPGERKEILAEVLGLKEYERREALARERVRAATAGAERLDRELADMDGELEGLPAAREELAALDGLHGETAAALATVRREREELEGRHRRLEAVRAEDAEVRRRLGEGERAVAELKAQVGRVEERRRTNLAVVAEREAIGTGYAAWQAVRDLCESLVASAQAHARVAPEVARAGEAVAAEERRLRAEIERLRREREEARARAGRLDEALRRVGEHGRQLERFHGLRVLQTETEAGLKRLADDIGGLRAAIRSNEGERERLRERYRQLKGVDGPAGCPVCGSPLDQVRRDELLREVEAEGREVARALRELEKLLQAGTAEAAEFEKRLAGLRSELAGEAGVVAALANAERDAAEARAGQESGDCLEREIAALEERFCRGEFAVEERQRLASAREALAALGYEPVAHQEAVAREQSLRPLAERRQVLRQAEQALAQDDEFVAGCRERLAALEETAAADGERLATLQGEITVLESCLDSLAGIQSRQQELELRERGLFGRRASAQVRLDRLTNLLARREERRRERAGMLKERSYWTELAEAYGKKGIQALIIENAIPELEREANDLLARWTEGRLSVRLLTQGTTRGGSVFETLDIVIADEMGTRRYELFSGGEKFRVDLALRIGLSKLLARRAGASLRLLVVDEGFGTQDAAAIEKLIVALNDLRGEFDKILVITHRPELKESFPVHIEVVKTHEGSQIRVAG